jgi:hypothetical protein
MSSKPLPDNLPPVPTGHILYGWGPVPAQYEGGRTPAQNDTVTGWTPGTSKSWTHHRAGHLSDWVYAARETCEFGVAISTGLVPTNYLSEEPPTAHEF